LLEPLTADPTDFVRQGALIALAMVLVQTSKAQEPRVEKIRKLFADKIADKHEDAMCKFGACVASGIIDAGGRNVTIAPRSVSGHINTNAVVGLAVFTQYWYWHPLAHFLCLSFTPTAIIGLNKDLKMPVFKFKSNAKPSLFAYPPEVKPPVTKAPQKMRTAELSITKKAKARANRKEQSKEAQPMETDEKEKEKEKGTVAMDTDDSNSSKTEGAEQASSSVAKGKEEKKAVVKKEEEPEFVVLSNPARVTTRQRKFLSFDVDERYKPVKQADLFGILMLKDNKPDQPEEYVTPSKPTVGGEGHGDESDEPEAPEPFDYDPEKEL